MSLMISKIALFLPNLNGGGAERMLVNLAYGLAQYEVSIDFILGTFSGKYVEQVLNLPKNVKIIDLHAKRVIKCIPKLKNYLNEECPDILLSTLVHANICNIIAGKMSKTKTKIIIREANTFSVHEKNNKSLYDKFIYKSARLIYKFADKIIAVSKGVKEDLINELNLKESKIDVIYNPVIDETITMKSNEKINLPFDAKYPVIISAGRMVSQKDFPTLIKAFIKVLEKKEARLIILGEVDKNSIDYEEVNQLMEKSVITDKVYLPGFVKNPFVYFNNSNVFVLSSKWEGLPGVLIQAMACGCSIVSTNCKSGPNEILDNGKYGSLVPIGDYNKMAEEIISKIENPTSRKELIKRAQDFNVKNSAENYINCFENVVNESINITLIGARQKIGGTTVLFNQLVSELKEYKDITIKVIDTTRENNDSKINAIIQTINVLVATLRNIRKTDLISLHSSTAGTINFGILLHLVSKIFRKPIVFRQFGGGLDIKFNQMTFIKKWILKTLVKSHTILLETKAQVKYFTEHFKKSNIIWYPNNRPLSDGAFINKEIVKSAKKFICIGHIKPEKGIIQTIEAFNSLEDNESILHFYGPLFEGCDESIFKGDRIEYKGILRPENVIKTLKEYDVLIMPSSIKTEGYPGVVIEGYFAGLPVIASDLRSMRELVINKETGILVRPGSSEDLKNAIDYFLKCNGEMVVMKSNIKDFSKQFESGIWTKKFIDICKDELRAKL